MSAAELNVVTLAVTVAVPRGVDPASIDFIVSSPAELLEVAVPRSCLVCGCTEETACEDGCYWVAENLCSECLEHVDRIDLTNGNPTPVETVPVVGTLL